MTGCPCNARGQTATVLPRQYPPQARSARLRLSVAGGPGRFAMNRRGGRKDGRGACRSEVFLRQHGLCQEYPHPARYPRLYDADLPAVKPNMAERAAAACSSAASGRPGDVSGHWPGARSSCAGLAFATAGRSAALSGCPGWVLVSSERSGLLLDSLLALCTVILVGGGREGISRTKPQTAPVALACGRPCACHE